MSLWADTFSVTQEIQSAGNNQRK